MTAELGTYEATAAEVLNSLAKRTWRDGHEKGHHGIRTIESTYRKPSAVELLALIGCEVSEAIEEYRKDGNPRSNRTALPAKSGQKGKPEGVASELADIIIRTLDYAHEYGINIGRAVIDKLDYNTTREWRHGKVL